MTNARKFITENKIEKYLKYSSHLEDGKLEAMVKAIVSKQDAAPASVNKESKMLQNFEKYQQIWYSNLERFEKGRNKHNEPTTSANSKVNRKQ